MCYGPLVPDGYAVCYNPLFSHINFAVTAFNCCQETNAELLAGSLQGALDDVGALLGCSGDESSEQDAWKNTPDLFSLTTDPTDPPQRILSASLLTLVTQNSLSLRARILSHLLHAKVHNCPGIFQSFQPTLRKTFGQPSGRSPERGSFRCWLFFFYTI